MKNTKRASMPTTRRPSTIVPSAAPRTSTAPTRRSSAATKPKAPTLATAARSVRTRGAPSSPTPAPRKAAAKRPSRAEPSSGANPRASLVPDAVRRAFHAAASGSGSRLNPSSEVSECEHLRGELVRVMADHQRQADEIVALRALARSLKEEVEAMQDAAAHEEREAAARSNRLGRAPVGHEFFQLDAHVDALREENAQLRDRIQCVEREKRELEDVLDREIPRCELLAVQARAELESTASQLRDEQHENDRLRNEIAYYKARSRSPVRARRQAAATIHGSVSVDEVDDKENDRTRPNVRAPQSPVDQAPFDESLRESLMSSVASLSMSAASAFSTQLQDDVETLKSELRRLHRSIDASMMTAARSNATHPSSRRRQQTQTRVEPEAKLEDGDQNAV